GLMNVQFAVQNGDVYVLEVNPRASRTVPFVAKATGVPIAKIAARVMTGEKLARLLPREVRERARHQAHVAVKEAVFPFARFPGVDLILGPEMKSTGEVMGIDADFGRAFAKSQLGSGTELPLQGCVFVSVRDQDKEALVEPCRQLAAWGFDLVATRGTAKKLEEEGVPVALINKVQEGRPDIVDRMRSGGVQLVFNTTEGAQAIAEARTHGDLAENAEYHAARERQSFIEGRVAELEDKIARAEVIDTSKLSGSVIKFGATVTLADEETDEEQTFRIVGEDEADI